MVKRRKSSLSNLERLFEKENSIPNNQILSQQADLHSIFQAIWQLLHHQKNIR